MRGRIAPLLRNDLIPGGHMISAAHREERDLLRARLRLVSQQVRCRLIVEGLLAQYNVSSVLGLPELVQLGVDMLAQQRRSAMWPHVYCTRTTPQCPRHSCAVSSRQSGCSTPRRRGDAATCAAFGFLNHVMEPST